MVTTFKLSDRILDLIFAMTLVSGKQKVGDVFQRNCLMKTYFIHFLHFVTGLSLIAWKDNSNCIVQTIIKAVKRKIISSAMKARRAYQMVMILFTYILSKVLQKLFSFRKDL